MSCLMVKPTKWPVPPAKTQISQGIWVWCPHEETLGPDLPNERTAKTDQTGRMPRLIWVFAGRTVILLVLSYAGSVIWNKREVQQAWLAKGRPYLWTYCMTVHAYLMSCGTTLSSLFPCCGSFVLYFSDQTEIYSKHANIQSSCGR